MRRLTLYERSRAMAVVLLLVMIIVFIDDYRQRGPMSPFNYTLCVLFVIGMWYLWRFLDTRLGRWFEHQFGRPDRSKSR